MSEAVVVVTGASTSPIGVLPFQDRDLQNVDEQYARIFSRREYGNYITELWSAMRSYALSPSILRPTSISEALKETPWTVITNTVDGLHEMAGCYPVLECSGSLFRGVCLRCQTVRELSREDYARLEGGVFACLKCGKPRLRPDVVLSGEKLRHGRLSDDFVRDSTTTVFVGVDVEDPSVERWKNLSARTVLVSPDPSGQFTNYIEMSPEEWAESGCPLI